MPPRREPLPLDLPNPTPPTRPSAPHAAPPPLANRTGEPLERAAATSRPIPFRPLPPPPLCALRRGPAAAQVEPTGTIASVIATSPAPHGGRGALPSAGGSPSDLLFLAGGGRDLRL
nr:unnamed protein product [Digitaria exilis]